MAIIYQSPNPLESLFQGINQGAFQVTIPYLLQMREQRRKAVQDILASAFNETSPLVFQSPEFQTLLESQGIAKNKHIKKFLDSVNSIGGNKNNKVLPKEANGQIVRDILKTDNEADADKVPLPRTSSVAQALAAYEAQNQPQNPLRSSNKPEPNLLSFLNQQAGISFNIPKPPEPGASIFEVNAYRQRAADIQKAMDTAYNEMVKSYSNEAAKNAFIVKDFNPKFAQELIKFFKANNMDVSPVIKIDANGGVTYDFSMVDPQIALNAANSYYNHLISAMDKVSKLEENLIIHFGNLDKAQLTDDLLSGLGLSPKEIEQVQTVAATDNQKAIMLAKKYAVNNASEMVRSWNYLIGQLSQRLGMDPVGAAFAALTIPDDKDRNPNWNAGIAYKPMGQDNIWVDTNTGKAVKVTGRGAGSPEGVAQANVDQSPYGQVLMSTDQYARSRAQDVVEAWKQMPAFSGWSTQDLTTELDRAVDFAWSELVEAGVPDDPDLQEAFTMQMQGAVLNELMGRSSALSRTPKEESLAEYWKRVTEEREKKKAQKNKETVRIINGVPVVGVGKGVSTS